MPLTALTEAQKIFLDNYIRKHAYKGRKKRERAEGFSDMRQQVIALQPRVPATGPEGSDFASRLRSIDAEAASGGFKAARVSMGQLLQDMRQLQAGYSPDADLATLKGLVGDFVRDADAAASAYARVTTALPLLAARSQPIAGASMPTTARGSPAWQQAATPLLNQRLPDAAAAAQGLAQCAQELGSIDYFLRMVNEDAVHGLHIQKKLAAEILKGDPTQAPLVNALLGRVRVQAFAPLCEPGQPGVFREAKAFKAEEDAKLRGVALQLRTLKEQLASLQADAGFGDVVTDAQIGQVGINVAQRVARKENPGVLASGHRRRPLGPPPVDRIAMQRAALERMRERARLIERRDADFDRLQAEQLADQKTLDALKPRPDDLSQKTPPPKDYALDSLAATLPWPGGDGLPEGSPNTDYMPEDKELAALAEASAVAVLKHIATEGITDFEGDEFFDLSLQSPRNIADAYCKARGWAGRQLTPGRRKVADAIGQAVFQRVLQFNAEKLSADGQKPVGQAIDLKRGQVLIGGKAYAQPKELARGGFGVVSRYESLDTPGAYVVVKSTIRGEEPKPPDDGPIERRLYEEQVQHRRDAMKREVKSHHHLMKAALASGDEGAANIVGMKGAMAAEDGSLHMVLEIVDGGDLDDNRMALMVAANSGALPEEARNALNQARIKQAAQGLKFMRDQDIVHFDIKGANFMVAGDGTVKVGDFGSAGASATGDGQVVADHRYNPGTQGYIPGQAVAGEVVDSAYDTFALGKVIQVAHLNATNPLQPGGKTEIPPEFEQLTGALARVTQAMTRPDAQDRPMLEDVLDSSYLRNLEAFDPAVLAALNKTAVDYAKALRSEAAAVRAQVPRADRVLWAGPKGDPDSLGFTDLVGPMQTVIAKGRARTLELRTALEALPPAPVVPQGAVSGQARLQAAFDRHQAAKQAIEAELAAERQSINDKEALLALFGQSPQAKALAQELRDISAHLLRPSVTAEDFAEPQLGARQIDMQTKAFTLRLSSLMPAIAQARLNPMLVAEDIKRMASEAGTLARRHQFDAANRMLDELKLMIGA